MSRRILVLGCLAAGLAGCGEKPEPTVTAPAAVQGTLDLPEGPAAQPDAGTEGGHQAPDFAETTKGASFSFTGSLKPPVAEVAIGKRPARATAEVLMRDGGRFRVRLERLRRGANAFELIGRAEGFDPWRAEVVITRR